MSKKGLHPFAWVAIGCGAFVVIGAIIFVAGAFFVAKKAKEVLDDPAKIAEVVIRANPDFELIDNDQEEGKITVRVKSTGETLTFDYDEIREGRFSVETDDGRMVVDADGGDRGQVTFSTEDGEARIGAGVHLDDHPDWVPLYPGAEAGPGGMVAESADGSRGMIHLTAEAGPREVIEFYRRELEDNGYKITATVNSTTGDGEGSWISAQHPSLGRTIHVSVSRSDGRTQLVVTYGVEG